MSLIRLQQCQKLTDATFNLCNNEPVQEILKCFFCQKFLSVAPIYNHGFESICGRCKFVNKSEDSKWIRQTLYENVAKFMIFPCSNVAYGCKAQLKWGEVEEHENTCLYKKLNCPFINDDIFDNEKCRWMGSGPGLNEHLENCHGDLIKKLPEINFSQSKENCIFLTRISKQLMIVTIKFEPPEKYSCLVMVNGTSTDCEAYRYQLELYDENRRNTIIVRRSRLEDAVGLDENLINPDKNLIIDLSVVSNLIKNPQTIMGRFGIIKKSKRETVYGDNRHTDAFPDENFLRELECPVCKNYMVPPINLCTTGHSFCHSCQQQMNECPTCRHPFEDGRNYTLEKLTSCINYPCMYKDAGCEVACPSEKLREHELDCSFSGIQCILDCDSECIMNMFQHLNEKHHDKLVVVGEVHILNLQDDNEDHYVKYFEFAICFGNDIFRLGVFYKKDIRFVLQQLGVKQSSYCFELEIICSTDCSEKIVMGKGCVPLSWGEVWDQSYADYLDLPENVIDRFISEDNLVFFKVHLKKIV